MNLNTIQYSIQRTIETPTPISSLSVSSSGRLATGSVDGCLRLYLADSSKVLKAIRGLGSEVEGTAFTSKDENENGNIWLTTQHKVLLFQLDSPKMILDLGDAIETLVLGEHEEDIVNEVTINHNKSKLAYTTDSGVVGVVDLATKKPKRMKVKHANIGWAVRFIPDRPSEIMSGGYDCAILHFDFVQGSLLSRLDFTGLPPESGISLSPPFVTSTAVFLTGIAAAGTADGRIWIGTGGEKKLAAAGGKKKKSRKWEGLKEADGLLVKVAEGPVVGLAFVSEDALISCTLLGTVTRHRLSRNVADGTLELSTTWTQDTRALAKVNALVVANNQIMIGGIGKNKKGVVEVWVASTS